VKIDYFTVPRKLEGAVGTSDHFMLPRAALSLYSENGGRTGRCISEDLDTRKRLSIL
jgi:hypothetical protein